MSILVKIIEDLDFGRNFQKISILVKFWKNLNYVKLSTNPDFGQNFGKIAIFVKIFNSLDFGADSRNISIFVEICYEIFIEVKIFEISRFWQKFKKNTDFGQNL